MENLVEETQEPQETEAQILTKSYKYFDFEQAEKEFQKLVGDWDSKVTNQATIRRNMRTVQVDVDALQSEGKLKADETLIPIRVIDANIKMEQPIYVAYVKQSRRLAVFKAISNFPVDDRRKQIVESEFTTALSYNGWEKWVYRVIDGGQLHGFCCAEVTLDTAKPGHVSIVAHEHENVIFSLKAKDLESQPFVIVRIVTTLSKLKDIAAAYGFNKEVVDAISEKLKDKELLEEVKIYKVFIKYEGVVYVAWFVLEYSENHVWLKEPTKLFLGREQESTEMGMDPMTMLPVPQKVVKPIDEIQYPVKLYRYQETEDQCIVETKGRAWLDAPSQEAQTALYSSFINGSVRSSNVYASPNQSSGGQLKRLDLNLEHGCFYSEPISFWGTPAPSMDLIKAAQSLDVRKQMETGQIAAATMARQDSRKLASELEMAQQTSDQLSSVQITNFAIFLTELFTHSWAIIQSRAIQNKIRFVVVSEDPMTGQFENDRELLKIDFQLRPAGDQDVVRRQEKIMAKQQLMPIIAQVVQTVGAAPMTAAFMVEYTIDLIYEVLPDEGPKYEQLLRQLLQQQQQMMMQQMQQQQQDPEILRQKAELQIEQQRAGMEMQQTQQEMQMDAENEGQKMQMMQQEHYQKLTQSQQEHQLKLRQQQEAAAEKIRLMKQAAANKP